MANDLDFYGLKETKETEKFVRMFDKSFDCRNVRCISASVQHRKSDLRPYRSPDDERLKVSCYICCSCYPPSLGTTTGMLYVIL